jgi:hypothetical protein
VPWKGALENVVYRYTSNLIMSNPESTYPIKPADEMIHTLSQKEISEDDGDVLDCSTASTYCVRCVVERYR